MGDLGHLTKKEDLLFPYPGWGIKHTRNWTAQRARPARNCGVFIFDIKVVTKHYQTRPGGVLGCQRARDYTEDFQGVDERATSDRYHQFHGHNGLCA